MLPVLRLALIAIILASAAARQSLAADAAGARQEFDVASSAYPSPSSSSAINGRPRAAEVADIGRLLFFDPQLSASRRLACAGCHVAAFRYGPSGPEPVRRGGPGLDRAGIRAVPSLAYGEAIPPFSEHYVDDEGNDGEDQGPAGGHDWDGRADSAEAQARGPLFSEFEMANADVPSVVAKLARAPYAEQFRATFGRGILEDSDRAIGAVLLALQTFQEDPNTFYPFSSKFDAVIRHQAVFTAQEARGRTVFEDRRKGNCAQCHPSSVRNGAFPLFTDFGLVALGVPRNAAIPSNRDPDFFDLGLCGPLRSDLRGHPEYCGLFKTPSLRNVALRRVFFHNGVYHRLGEVLRFYARRDSDPAAIYPRDDSGQVRKFNDLPEAFWPNVSIQPPFNRTPGAAPALNDAEIRDLIAFLKTLTDGYQPRVPPTR